MQTIKDIDFDRVMVDPNHEVTVKIKDLYTLVKTIESIEKITYYSTEYYNPIASIKEVIQNAEGISNGKD